MAEFPKNLHILIMAGGSGTRFWPRSRQKKPKQLLCLWDETPLITHTLKRFSEICDAKNLWIVTSKDLLEPTRETLGEGFSQVRFLGEPAAKNTAACVLWGIKEISRKDPEAIIAVMPADSYIGDLGTFHQALSTAAIFASHNPGFVTLGIKPNRPETGYGYIETGALQQGAIYKTARFVEKPDLRTANRYIESGKYLWNAGMFIFAAKFGLQAFEATMPTLFSSFSGTAPIESIYNSISAENSVSIDYGVMEKCNDKNLPVYVLPTDFGWNDVGSFVALEEIQCSQLGGYVAVDAGSNITQTDEGFIALLGVQDLVVVRDKEVVLVAAKDKAQNIKLLLEQVKKRFPESA